MIFHAVVFQKNCFNMPRMKVYTYIFIDFWIWIIKSDGIFFAKLSLLWYKSRLKFEKGENVSENMVFVWRYILILLLLLLLLLVVLFKKIYIWNKIILRIFICSWNYWFSSYSMYYINYIATLNINIQECFFYDLLSCKNFQKFVKHFLCLD